MSDYDWYPEKSVQERKKLEYYIKIANDHWIKWLDLRIALEIKSRFTEHGYKCHYCGKPVREPNCFCISDTESVCSYMWLKEHPEIILEWITQ